MPDGTVHAREVVRHPGAVVLLPITDDGRICFVRNFRISVDKTLLELPAGTLESGEDPLDTAGRELAEETGYRAGRIEPLTTFYMSPGILDEKMYAFVATELSPGAMNLDVGEQLEPVLLTWEEAIEAARSGQIEDSKSLSVLFCYRLQVKGDVA